MRQAQVGANSTPQGPPFNEYPRIPEIPEIPEIPA